MSKVMLGFSLIVCLLLLASGVPGAKPPEIPLPKVSELPENLPSSTVKEDGQASAVRATAQHLKVAVTKICPQCGGTGKVQVSGRGPGLQRPVDHQCDKCGGSGRVPNESGGVDAAALAVVTSIVRMSPDAPNASNALNQAYDSITENILKSQRNFGIVQEQSAATLAQVKPQVDKVVILKAIFAGEIPDPKNQGKSIYILRVAHKKQVIAVHAPKQADPPLEGERALVAGVISGTVEADAGGPAKEPIVIIDHGFLISPNINDGWWTKE
jgi:hypothetical protein